jgi:hypothetical protein
MTSRAVSARPCHEEGLVKERSAPDREQELVEERPASSEERPASSSLSQKRAAAYQSRRAKEEAAERAKVGRRDWVPVLEAPRFSA